MRQNLTGTYAIVLRMQGMFPCNLRRFEKHQSREQGDFEHVDRSRSHLNKRLIGNADWAQKALDRIQFIRLENHRAELDSLRRRKRKKELASRQMEGPKDPWRPTRHGPLREIILTANAKYFQQRLPNGENPVEAFENIAVTWLKDNFGEDLVHAHSDHDETAYHIHAVLLPIKRIEMTRTQKNGERNVVAHRWMIEPSKHPLVRNYEAAQDSVGVAFSGINLARGEARSAAIREARKSNRMPPKRRYHQRSTTWRAKQETSILKRKSLLAKLERSCLDYGKQVASREAAVKVAERKIVERQASLDAQQNTIAAAQVEQEAMFAALDAYASGNLELHGNQLQLTTQAQHSSAVEAINGHLNRLPRARHRVISVISRLAAKLGTEARQKAEQDVIRDTLAIRRAKTAIDDFMRKNGQKAANGLNEAVLALSTCLISLRRHDPEYKVRKKDSDQR